MTKKHWIAIPFIAVSALFAQSPDAEQQAMQSIPEIPKMEMKDIDFAKLSETLGHLLGKNLESLGFDVELAKVFNGIQKAFDGKDAPMSESECYQSITVIQEHKHQVMAQENLAKAEEFLKENARRKGMVSLEENKLQYVITHKGSGTSVKAGDSPKIRFVGTYADGSEFARSENEEHISLNEDFLVGLTKGMIGMKEGEKRSIYIHPDLAFQDKGGAFPPNAMVAFDIELVKADEPFESPEDIAVEDETLFDETEELASIETPEEHSAKK